VVGKTIEIEVEVVKSKEITIIIPMISIIIMGTEINQSGTKSTTNKTKRLLFVRFIPVKLKTPKNLSLDKMLVLRRGKTSLLLRWKKVKIHLSKMKILFMS
jgi:hypothetical protein